MKNHPPNHQSLRRDRRGLEELVQQQFEDKIPIDVTSTLLHAHLSTIDYPTRVLYGAPQEKRSHPSGLSKRSNKSTFIIA